MKTSIVYFSRSNKTKMAAEKLSKLMNVKVYEVTDNMNWKGLIGYLRGGFYASTNRKVEITYDAECLDAKQLIVMSPLWAGGPSPAIRTFIRDNSDKNINLVLTNDGSDVNKAFAKVKILFPDIKRHYGITKRLKNENEVLNIIKDDLGK